MNHEWYQYIRKLHQFIEHQNQTVRRLQTAVNELQEEVAHLKSRPPVTVDKIEYKFDQLKVETLEGTLNIGLNPSDLDGITDFSVDNQTVQPPISPKNIFMRNMEIEKELQEFLDLNLPEIYNDALKNLDLTVDESYYAFIKEDIAKQLPSRIDAHMKNREANQAEMDESAKQEIVNKIKTEIQHGVFLFLTQLKEQNEG